MKAMQCNPCRFSDSNPPNAIPMNTSTTTSKWISTKENLYERRRTWKTNTIPCDADAKEQFKGSTLFPSSKRQICGCFVLCLFWVLSVTSLVQNTYAVPEVSALSPSEQQLILKKVKGSYNYKNFPNKLIELIKPETIIGTSSTQEDHQVQKFNIVFQDRKDGLLMYVIVDQHGRDMLAARRTTASAKDVTEKVSVPEAFLKTERFPLPSDITTALKKEGMLDKFALMAKILNANFNLSLIMPGFSMTKAKKGEYIGKLVDMPTFTFEEIPAVTQNMDTEEVALRKKLGFAFTSMTDIPGLILANSSSKCPGIAYVYPRVGNIRSASLAGESVILTGEDALLVVQKTVQYVKLSAKEIYYKKLQKNFHALMLENGVEPGTDHTKMKGESAEKKAWAAYGNMFDRYYETLDKELNKINKSKPTDKSFVINPGKPDSKPIKQKQD